MNTMLKASIIIVLPLFLICISREMYVMANVIIAIAIVSLLILIFRYYFALIEYMNDCNRYRDYIGKIEKNLGIKPDNDDPNNIDKHLSRIEAKTNEINKINISFDDLDNTFVNASDCSPVFMSKSTASKYISRMDNVRFDRGVTMVPNLHLPCKISCDITSSRSHHITYKTTLTSCTCPDFDNEKEPCKHMIALALAVGALLPARDCNIEFNGAGLSDEVDHLNATRRALTSEIELLNKQLEKAKNDLNEITEKIASAKKEHNAALSSLAHVKDLLNQVADRDQVLIKDDLMKKYNERFPDDRFERGVDISKNTSMIKEKIINCNIKCKMPSASIPNKYYYTTLEKCTCQSYIYNNKEGLPCKHMIALAIATKVIQPANTERNTSCPTAST